MIAAHVHVFKTSRAYYIGIQQVSPVEDYRHFHQFMHTHPIQFSELLPGRQDEQGVRPLRCLVR